MTSIEPDDLTPAPTEPSPLPPAHEDLRLISELRTDLSEAGFTNDGLHQLLGSEVVAALDREQEVPGQLRVLEVLASAEDANFKAAVLAGLWLVSVDVTADQVQAALPRTGVHGLQRLNLADVLATPEQDGHAGIVVPRADLRPYQVETRSGQKDLWVTSDLSAHQMVGSLPHDHVLGVGQASLTLAGVTHRRSVEAALDIGTGCGIQLLQLLDHAEHVVGTDLSERALDFARFNLVLNAEALDLDPHHLEDRVELIQGSLLEPVQGRSFDLIVSNPPFVITPRCDGETVTDRYTYRDGGRQGDALIQELIAGLPAVLNPGGTTQLLANWEEHTDDADWQTRPRRWVQDTGLDAWFIQRDAQSPSQYAEIWLRDASQERSIAEYRRSYADYVVDFRARGVEQVGFGMIWLHKHHDDGHDDAQQTPKPWIRFEQLTGEIQQPLGPVIGATVERARAAASPQQALGQPLLIPETVTEERYQRFGAEHPEVIIARQGEGFRRSRPISSAAAGFMAAADGEFTAAQLITAVCSLTDTHEDALRSEVLELYVEGYVTPA